jgi:RNA polymerase sigma-70 factor (ECF subfamily)
VDLTIRVSTCQRVVRAARPLERDGKLRLAAAWKHAEPQLRRLAERLCRDRADAADLVQDALLRAATLGMPTDVRNPCAWLTTILHNLFVDRCRADARKPAHEMLCDAHEAAVQHDDRDPEPAWGELTIDDVRAALPALDRIYRDVYIMHTFERRSYEAIAARLEIDRVTVGTRLSRARRMLREVLSGRRGNKP